MLHCYSPRQSFLSLQGRPHRPKRRRTVRQTPVLLRGAAAARLRPGRRHREHEGTGTPACRPAPYRGGAPPAPGQSPSTSGELRSAEPGLGAAVLPEQAPLGQPGSPRPCSSARGPVRTRCTPGPKPHGSPRPRGRPRFAPPAQVPRAARSALPALRESARGR